MTIIYDHYIILYGFNLELKLKPRYAETYYLCYKALI